MNNYANTRSPRKKKRSPGPDLGLLVLVLSIIATAVLVFLAKPLPYLMDFIKAAVEHNVVAMQPSPGTSTTTTPISAQQPNNAAPPPNLPAGSVYMQNPKLPLTVTRVVEHGIPIYMVEGGSLGARRSAIRQGVLDFVRQAGATAGVNGTFFENASLRGTNNRLIGPSLCDNESIETMSAVDTKPVLEGRPLVLVSPTSTCIVPYDIPTMSMPGAIQSLDPGVTSAFLAGVWLVRGGMPATLDQLAAFKLKDAEDPRRRAFFAIMPDGRPVVGATDGSLTSRHLAEDLADVGVQEAVLLDSGFSASLVFQNTILVTGHSSKNVPSRPVPQALLLYGPPDPSTLTQLQPLATLK